MSARTQPPVYSPLNLTAILRATVALARSGSTLGALRDALRRDFDASAAALTDSGTSALALALGTEETGAPVALPAYSCFNLATAADAADRPVILYDVVPETLAPDLGSLRAALDGGARTVVVAPLFGFPIEMAPIGELCAAHGALLIEDAAQHAGATIGGIRVGSFGPVTVLSFGRGKGATGGSGGALLGRREGEAMVRAAVQHLDAARRGVAEVPKLAAQWLLARPGLYALPASLPFLNLGETIYHAPWRARGISRAALGALSKTRAFSEVELAVRRRHVTRLLASLEGRTWIRPVRAPAGSEPGYLRLPVIVDPPHRTASASREARRLGIMPGYPRSLADLQGFISRVRNAGAPFSGARALAKGLFTLPTHSLLSDADIRRLAEWIRRVDTDT